MAGIFNSQDDALGNGLMSRAAAYKNDWNLQAKENARQHGQLVSFGQIGPMGDPRWDAFFQAMDEAGVSKAGDNSMGVKQGMFGGAAPLPSTFDPTFQRSAVVDSGRSRQINAQQPPALQGLTRATRQR